MQRNIFMDIIHITIKSNVHVFIVLQGEQRTVFNLAMDIIPFCKNFFKVFFNVCIFFVSVTNMEQKHVITTRQKLRNIPKFLFINSILNQLTRNKKHSSRKCLFGKIKCSMQKVILQFVLYENKKCLKLPDNLHNCPVSMRLS